MMTASEQKDSRQIVEFVPFGTKDKIALSIEIVKRIVAVKTKTGKGCSDEDAFKFMLMCQARKLNPFEGDAFLIGYDSQSGPSFSLITAHQAFLKRAELHPEFDGMESGTIVLRNGETTDLVGDWHMPNDSILGGWAIVFFKNRSHPMHKRVRLARFNKNYGIWRDDPAGMIVKCAEADALRSSFPTMLGGLYIHEEMPTIEAEIARPVFQNVAAETETAADQTARPSVRTEEKKAPETPAAESVKKKEVPPDLRRKSQTAPSDPTTTEPPPAKLKSPRERFVDMLAIGNCTPTEFVKIAIDQGWIDVDEGKFDEIAEARIIQFMNPDNWPYIMQAIDEHRAKNETPPRTHSDKLL